MRKLYIWIKCFFNPKSDLLWWRKRAEKNGQTAVHLPPGRYYASYLDLYEISIYGSGADQTIIIPK